MTKDLKEIFSSSKYNPRSWPLVRMREIIIEMRGGAPFKPTDFVDDGFPVLHKGAIKPNGKLEFDSQKQTCTHNEFVHEYSRSRIDRRYIALTLRDLVPSGPSIGLMSYLKYAPHDSYILAQGSYGLLVDEERVFPQYLVWLSNYYPYRLMSKALSVGSTQIHIRNIVFTEMKIPLPPLEEQKRFAHILDEKLTAVSQARAAAQAQLEAAQALTAAYLREIFNGREAQQWPVKPLGEVCDFIGGSQPPKSTFRYRPAPGYVRLVQIQDFRLNDVAVYIPEDLARRSFEKDDVMIGRYGPPVFQILRGLSGAYNVALMKAEPKEGMTKEFLYYLLQEPALQRSVIDQSQRSAGQSGVNRQSLETYKMHIPLPEKQVEIATYLDKQIEKSKQIENMIIEQQKPLQALSGALLRQAFSGEL